MFDGLISNNEENKKFALPPDTPLTKKYFFISLNQYKNINIYISSVYLV